MAYRMMVTADPTFRDQSDEEYHYVGQPGDRNRIILGTGALVYHSLPAGTGLFAWAAGTSVAAGVGAAFAANPGLGLFAAALVAIAANRDGSGEAAAAAEGVFQQQLMLPSSSQPRIQRRRTRQATKPPPIG